MRPIALLKPLLLSSLSILLLCCGAPVDKDGNVITHGSFRLRTFPTGAKVWINGELKVAETPATLVLPAGKYDLVLQHPGAKKVSKSIRIVAGKKKDRTFNIPKPPPATITVMSDVLGASVRVNGYVRGRTPLVSAVTRPGPIDITLTAPNSQAKSMKTNLGLSEQKTIEIFYGDVACLFEDNIPEPSRMSLPPPTGIVTLAFKPAGSIYDSSGKKLGESPLLNRIFPAGTHRLRLVSDNNKYEQWVRIDVEEDERHVFRFRVREKKEAN